MTVTSQSVAEHEHIHSHVSGGGGREGATYKALIQPRHEPCIMQLTAPPTDGRRGTNILRGAHMKKTQQKLHHGRHRHNNVHQHMDTVMKNEKIQRYIHIRYSTTNVQQIIKSKSLHLKHPSIQSKATKRYRVCRRKYKPCFIQLVPSKFAKTLLIYFGSEWCRPHVYIQAVGKPPPPPPKQKNKSEKQTCSGS